MNLNDLKKELPFKWRVQSTNQYGSNCVAYIDARDVQDLLDEVVGADGWQCKYEEHKGNLFCSIGVYTKHNDWIWKSDCGTESQVEKQKGEASDAFKRAAVMWGVGRFLYSLDIIKIKEVIQKNNKFYPAHNGKQIWDINVHCNNIRNNKQTYNKPIPQPTRQKPVLEDKTKQWQNVVLSIDNGKITNLKQVEAVYKISVDNKKKLELLIK